MKRITFTLVVLWIIALATPLVAQDAPATKQRDGAKPAAAEAIDFERARKLLQRRQGGEKLSADEESYLRRAQEARRGGKGTAGGRERTSEGGKETVGLKPLTEMSADDRYKGQDGGLYGKGRNTPPDEHRKAVEAELTKIEPLDSAGKPAKDGKIALVSISMSNATQEFSTFKRIADADPQKSPLVTIVDCAQGGQAMAEWVDPQARPWQEADRRLEQAKVSAAQVQAAWIKLANKGPRGDLQEHGKKLERDTVAVIQNAKARFPNLRVVYLGSRIYGGYSGGALNPEPYAYESAFVVRWLIQNQIQGDAALNYNASRGPVKAPVLVWGPYFWADGVTPRKEDGLAWNRTDLGPDGTHPSNAGREKVAKLLLDYFKGDPLAKSWFAKAGR